MAEKMMATQEPMELDAKQGDANQIEEQLENLPVAVSATPEEEHVTIKTWLVITVCRQ